ncbi:charged multivesicular body protein 7 [Procambarus clarkii]|uniref:charged multivesicular body protein 7 n=1 Tax=Procambarus clarkii TaxID=6728 RepID=UPI001E671619|nr:charged multivesicular body protein 7-like [Procambarus clarkii]XP_045594166.1 charged multivesicular body protein 7-like [Procambarus clarkii]XP_045594167.1 charged multivesicular body protein 7-like [Procambarus clarkii]XP_045594168.1 charged multivesicular body protein 7-like [Procambarus clarkii]XP_045594170.1 charged multivesicular body protein 7-like [Procambarus clarkii]
MDSSQNYLPPEWDNDERMRVLLGPMPVAQDSVAMTARCTFWSAAIHHWCRVMQRLTFTLLDCQKVFRRGTQTPLSLPDVLLHMNRLGEVLPIQQLPLGEAQEESWIGWGHRIFIAGPSRVAWNKLKQVIGVNDLKGTTLVNTVLLQEMSDKVFSKYWESSRDVNCVTMLVSLADLYCRVGEYVGSPDNLYLVINTLSNHQRVTTIIHNGTTHVKFAQLGDTNRPTITQMELAEYDLDKAQQQVQASVTQLSDEMTRLQQEARRALRAGSKIEALSMLRRKKRVETSLTMQLRALENVTTCIQQLQDTRNNKQVLEAFRVGVEAIRGAVMGDASADRAAATMDELQQVLDECQDVSSVLAVGVQSLLVEEDDDALDLELDQLLTQHQQSQPLDQQLADKLAEMQLPDVPKSNPMASLGMSSLYSPDKMT